MSFENPLEDILKTSLPYKMRQESEREKIDTENRFVPLEKAIKAQNALAYSGRTGSIGQFLRGISELPVAERQAYLSDPANRKNYMRMLEDFRTGVSGGGGSNSILTPEFLNQQFGGGAGGGGENAITSLLGSLFSGGKNPMNESGGQGQPQGPDQQMPQMPSENGPQQPQAARPQQPEVPKLPKENPELSDQERGLLGSQLLANNKMVGSGIANRADNAIAFEGLLQNIRPKINQLMKDAIKYNQVYGRGKQWMDKFKSKQPAEYASFITLRDSIIPLLSNGVRFLENMGVSHESQQEANSLISQLGRIDVSPETALKAFNNSISALYDVSEGVLNASEPLHKGVRRRMSGVKALKGDYISKSGPESDDYGHMTDAELRAIVGGG